MGYTHGKRRAIEEPYEEEAKREYCGPYLIALPPPARIVKYVPTRSPYRIEKTRTSDGKQWLDRMCDDLRIGMGYLWDGRPGVKAILFDADGSFIASVERKYSARKQKYA